eukprot:EG_transcript_7341
MVPNQGPSHFLSVPRWGLALLCGVAWAGLHGRYTRQCRNSAEALPSAMQWLSVSVSASGDAGPQQEGYALGIDCGTQSLKVTLIDRSLQTVAESNVAFDTELPMYGTSGGCHRTGLRVTAPPLMWVEALDLGLIKILRHPDCPDFANIEAVAFSAQQHGTVYWAQGAEGALRGLDPQLGLRAQLQDAFAVPASPLWLDGSTAAQCRRLEERMGGPAALAALTGARAYPQFSGNQIAYLRDTHPEQYDRCEHISLVSSFLASLFLGHYAPLDAGDGSMMNLLALATRRWHLPALEACGGPDLLHKLGEEVVPSATVLGPIHPYFVQRFGFPPTCRVVAGSGDNNCSLVGMRAQAEDMMISLGTSDTTNCTVRQGTGTEMGYLLCHPVVSDGFMAMLCYANGSLVRERVRDTTVGPDWGRFSAALRSTPPGNDGHIGIYFLTREIVPSGCVPGFYRFGPSDEPLTAFPDPPSPDMNYDVRAVVEGQCLAKWVHASTLGYAAKRIVACGGAAANADVLQVLADVFGLPV